MRPRGCTRSNAALTPKIRRKIFNRRRAGSTFITRPGGRGVRIDSHVYTGYTVPPHYDSLIAKIITVGATRINAIDRMRRALDEYYITGIKTTVPFHAAIMRNGEFRDGNYDTGFIERVMSSGKLELTVAVLHDPACVQCISNVAEEVYSRLPALRHPGSRATLTISDASRVAEAMIEGGVDLIQLRGKERSIEELVDLAAELHELTAPIFDAADCERSRRDRDEEFRWKACTSDRMMIRSRSCGAKRVAHVLVGKSTHSLEQALAQRSARAPITLASVRFSPRRPNPITQPIGLERYQADVHREVSLPIFCIGGIKIDNLDASHRCWRASRCRLFPACSKRRTSLNTLARANDF